MNDFDRIESMSNKLTNYVEYEKNHWMTSVKITALTT